jgi:transcriptional regulator with XRE-family HTH domain
MHFDEKIKKLSESQGLLQCQLAANLEIEIPMFRKIEHRE